MSKPVRKALSKKIRFEVFKRDAFTCQYCGKSAPDVVLNADHINPVANGGSDNILNLITSCFDCNSGKKDRLLSDETILKKQINQTKIMAEKRAQAKMLADWHVSMRSLDDYELSLLEKAIGKYEVYLSEYGKAELKKTIKKFGLSDVLIAVDKSANQYLNDVKEKSQRIKFLDYIPKICYWQKRERDNPVEAELRKIAYTANKLWWKCYPQELTRRLFQLNLEQKLTPRELLNLVSASTGIMKFEEQTQKYLEARNV